MSFWPFLLGRKMHSYADIFRMFLNKTFSCAGLAPERKMKYWQCISCLRYWHQCPFCNIWREKNECPEELCIFCEILHSCVLFPVWISKLICCLMKVWYPKSSWGICTTDRSCWLHKHDLLWQACGTGRNKGVKWWEQALNATAQIRWKYHISDQVLTLTCWKGGGFYDLYFTSDSSQYATSGNKSTKRQINIVIAQMTLLDIAFPHWTCTYIWETHKQEPKTSFLLWLQWLRSSDLKNHLTLKCCWDFFFNVHVPNYCLLIQVGLLKCSS